MKEGNFKKEAKLMLWFFLMLPVMGLVAAYLGPHLITHQKCMKYEPEVVRLQGKVERVAFLGPPNYESIKNGGRPEPYWVLYLPSGVCVQGNPKVDLNSETEQDVKELQLMMEDYNKYQRLRVYTAAPLRYATV